MGARPARLLLACCLVFAACSSSKPSPNPSDAKSSAPAGSPIDGGYVRGEQQLVLGAGRYHAVIATGLTADGGFSASGSTVTFSGGGECTGSGRYRWRLAEGKLKVTEAHETCSLRRFGLAGRWTPVPVLANANPGEFALLSDGTNIASYRGTAEAPASGTLRVKMRTPDWPSFDPTVIRGAPGQRVDLSLVNLDRIERHSFTIPEQGIDVTFTAGDPTPVLVTVTIPESGTLAFVCTFHRAVYMWGELQAT